MTRSVRLILAILAFAAATPAGAAAPDEAALARDADTAARALEEEKSRGAVLDESAAALARESDALRAELIAVARRVQGFEVRLTEVEETVAWLERERAARQVEFERRRDETGTALAALVALARRPAETLIGRPGDMRSTFHGHVLLATTVPALMARAQAVDVELAGLDRIERQLVESRDELAGLLRSLSAESATLTGLLARKEVEQAANRAERERAQGEIDRLTAQAQSLHELLDSVVRARHQAGVAGLRPAQRSFSAARGSLALPVEGRVVKRFGDPLPDGGQSRGIAIETRAGARVVTPFDGEVVFAGEFRGMGQLLIIAHGEGYHTLLAGFSRIDSVLGQWLLAGEPVGTVGTPRERSARLTIELRRGGSPVNPVPWLTAGDSRISG